MTRMDVLNSIALKKRFAKDNSLPIAVFDEPYFMERLETLDIYNNCLEKFDAFCAELSPFRMEQDYFDYYNKVKEDAIHFIKNHSEDYRKFVGSEYCVVPVTEKHKLYTDVCDGGLFISIDMKQANFSAMRHFSADIFNGAETWEDFIGLFTGSLHIRNSKYIRQVIFGACNPRKQVKYENFLMNVLCGYIMDKMPGICVHSLENDEIIIDVDKSTCELTLSKLRKIISGAPDGIGSVVTVKQYELNSIGETGGWLKTYSDGEIEFKCLGAEIFPQIVKYYYEMPITENDLVFYCNGALARFLKEVDDPWKI